MALTVDKLINDERFCGDSMLQLLLYLPIGLILMCVRIVMALMLWVASILLPNKSAVRQMLSTWACWTFGVLVRVQGRRDPRCSVLVANYVSCLDSLAAAHALGTISLRKWKVPPFFAATLGIRNAAQFIRKEHFGESPSKPVLIQPEGGPTNGKALLKFTDWPFQIGNRVQPVAISNGGAVVDARGGARGRRLARRRVVPVVAAHRLHAAPAAAARPQRHRPRRAAARAAGRHRARAADRVVGFQVGGGVRRGGGSSGVGGGGGSRGGGGGPRGGGAAAAGGHRAGGAARGAAAGHTAGPRQDPQRGRDDHELPGGRDPVPAAEPPRGARPRPRPRAGAALPHARPHGRVPPLGPRAAAQLPRAQAADAGGGAAAVHQQARTQHRVATSTYTLLITCADSRVPFRWKGTTTRN